MVRVAVNEEAVSKTLIDLSAMVGVDGVPLHYQLFPKLWLDIYNSKNIAETTLQSSIRLLTESSAFLEYVDAVLLDERSSLNNQYVYQFLQVFFPKVSEQVINHQVASHIQSFVIVLESVLPRLDLTTPTTLKNTIGDLRALLLVLAAPSDIQVGGLGLSLALLRERIGVALHDTTDDKFKAKDGDKTKDVPGPSKDEPIELKDDQKPGSSSKKSRSCDKLSDLLVTLSTTVNALMGLLVKRKKTADGGGTTASGGGTTAAGGGTTAAGGIEPTADTTETDSTAKLEASAAADPETAMDTESLEAAKTPLTAACSETDAVISEMAVDAETMAESNSPAESKTADKSDESESSEYAASNSQKADESEEKSTKDS